VIRPQHRQHFFGRGRVGQGGEAWQLAAHHGDLAAVALEQRLALGGHEQLGYLG